MLINRATPLRFGTVYNAGTKTPPPELVEDVKNLPGSQGKAKPFSDAQGGSYDWFIASATDVPTEEAGDHIETHAPGTSGGPGIYAGLRHKAVDLPADLKQKHNIP